jgi:hypothetical protein
MTLQDEIADGIKGVRGLLDYFEENAAQDDPAMVRATLVKLAAALISHGRPERTSDKSPRGLGYGQPGKQEIGPDGKPLFRADGQPLKYTTPDDAMIVASLPWFNGNMSAAIRAHFSKDNLTKEGVDNHADRIRGHRREIEDIEGETPWETSANWLGDLPAK